MSTILLQPAMPPRLPGVLLISLGLHAALMLGLRGPAAPSKPPLASLYAELRGAQSSAKQAIPTPSPAVLKALPPPPAKETRYKLPLERTSPPVRRNLVLATAGAAPSMPAPGESRPAAESAVAASSLSAQSEMARQPVPSPSVSEPVRSSQGDLLDSYRRQLAALLNRPREYPPIAALRGWEGEVRLLVKIARKGSLLAVSLDRSSGFAVLDQHALAVLERQLDFPPLPERWEGSEIQVVVPIHYKLKKTT